jgi:hypothetical protein
VPVRSANAAAVSARPPPKASAWKTKASGSAIGQKMNERIVPG